MCRVSYVLRPLGVTGESRGLRVATLPPPGLHAFRASSIHRSRSSGTNRSGPSSPPTRIDGIRPAFAASYTQVRETASSLATSPGRISDGLPDLVSIAMRPRKRPIDAPMPRRSPRTWPGATRRSRRRPSPVPARRAGIVESPRIKGLRSLGGVSSPVWRCRGQTAMAPLAHPRCAPRRAGGDACRSRIAVRVDGAPAPRR